MEAAWDSSGGYRFFDIISWGAEEAICKRFFMKFWKLKIFLSMNPYELP
jgi:hypothetical protein